jgi:purine-binding chemotaxis protein CheW
MNAAYVTLGIAGETYAAAAAGVSEVVKLQPLTRIPAMPRCIRGLMNLRGTVIPVVDLAQQLGAGETELTARTCVAVVDTPTEVDGVRSLMGVISHEVEDVVMVDESAIEPAPAFGTRIPPAYLAGITRVGERFVLILDLAHILSADELLAVHEAARS